MREKIHSGNYEAYLLDYLEGRLTREEREALFLFLEAHPELGKDLEEVEMVKLTPPEVVYEGKETLQRPDLSFESIDSGNAEEAMIALHEGELSPGQREMLEEYLQLHPEKQRDLELYGKVYLKPPAAVLAGKSDLYKKERRIVPWIPAAAAGIALLLAVSFLLRQTGNTSPERVTAEVAADHRQGSPATHPDQTLILPADHMTSGEKPLEDKKVRRVPSLKKERSAPSVGRSLMASTTERTGSLTTAGQRGMMTPKLPLLVPLPVEVQTSSLVIPVASPKEDIDLLAERTGRRIRLNMLRRRRNADEAPKPTPREVFFNGLARINEATGLNLNYEIKEDPDKGREYVAVTSRYFSYIRKKNDNR